MNSYLTSLRIFLWLTFITGVAYPLLILLIAILGFENTRNGEIVEVNGKIVGVKLIGQHFTSERYFFGRPSNSNYNSLVSGGSNLSATSLKLRNQVEDRKKMLTKINSEQKIPSELLFASGSGLDPHISLASAYFQIGRIVKARKLDPIKGRQQIEIIIQNLREHQFLAFENPFINVLLLNVALDKELFLE
jgi:K+-transporting ATPase ATPase C chain